jgi:hypothetical protein
MAESLYIANLVAGSFTGPGGSGEIVCATVPEIAAGSTAAVEMTAFPNTGSYTATVSSAGRLTMVITASRPLTTDAGIVNVVSSQVGAGIPERLTVTWPAGDDLTFVHTVANPAATSYDICYYGVA